MKEKSIRISLLSAIIIVVVILVIILGIEIYRIISKNSIIEELNNLKIQVANIEQSIEEMKMQEDEIDSKQNDEDDNYDKSNSIDNNEIYSDKDDEIYIGKSTELMGSFKDGKWYSARTYKQGNNIFDVNFSIKNNIELKDYENEIIRQQKNFYYYNFSDIDGNGNNSQGKVDTEKLFDEYSMENYSDYFSRDAEISGFIVNYKMNNRLINDNNKNNLEDFKQYINIILDEQKIKEKDYKIKKVISYDIDNDEDLETFILLKKEYEENINFDDLKSDYYYSMIIEIDNNTPTLLADTLISAQDIYNSKKQKDYNELDLWFGISNFCFVDLNNDNKFEMYILCSRYEWWEDFILALNDKNKYELKLYGYGIQ